MLGFGAAEYADFFFVKAALGNAARVGARAAIPSASTNGDVTAAVSAALSAAHVPSGSCTVTTSPADLSSAAAGTVITVTVTASWGTVGVTPLPAGMGGISPTRQVTGAAAMIREQ